MPCYHKQKDWLNIIVMSAFNNVVRTFNSNVNGEVHLKSIMLTKPPTKCSGPHRSYNRLKNVLSCELFLRINL